MDHRAPDPVGLYEPFVAAGPLVAISAISSAQDGKLITGTVGREVDMPTAEEAARRAARNLLAVINDAVAGDLSRVRQVLMIRGHVNASPEFALVHQVIDAASQVIIAELGDRGRHARTAIGCSTLPNRNAVTLEALVMVEEAR
jgi:enamine deaminase RidA (YjgF/YER057c/UK114 family)